MDGASNVELVEEIVVVPVAVGLEASNRDGITVLFPAI